MKQTYNRLRLGLKIRMRRHVMKMTQAQLAEKLGCAVDTISALEHGRRNISVERLFALSRALEYPLHELLMNID